MGCTLAYLGVLVLLPLSLLFIRAGSMGWGDFWAAIASPRAMAAFKLSFGASLSAAVLNAGFGLVVAWVLVRYSFPGRALVDALVDLPFALPTAVAGIALAGWLVGLLLKSTAMIPFGPSLALGFVAALWWNRPARQIVEGYGAGIQYAWEKQPHLLMAAGGVMLIGSAAAIALSRLVRRWVAPETDQSP